MKAIHHIIGEISRADYDANAASVIQFFADNKDADEYEIIISSPGGVVSEGFAMADAIRSLSGGKPVTTIAFTCMSIATLVFLSGTTRLVAANSEFMIHNPWIGFAAGDSDDIRKTADDLERVESKIAKYYAQNSNEEESKLRELMKEESYITPEDVVKMGFATEILTESKSSIELFAEAVAYTDESKKKSNHIMSKLNEALSRLDKKIGKLLGQNKALKIALSNGDVLDIDSEEMKAQEGDLVSIDDKQVEDGEYQTAGTGEVFVIKNGKIDKIKKVEEKAMFNVEDVEHYVSKSAEVIAKRLESKSVGIEAFTKQQEELLALKTDYIKVVNDLDELKNIFSDGIKELKAEVINNPDASLQNKPGDLSEFSAFEKEEQETLKAMHKIKENYIKNKK